jgi:hypothetical protein
MEATSTRRAGLERFTFPKGTTPFFTLDLANDLPQSFQGGNLEINPETGRITIGGHWGSRHVNKGLLFDFLGADGEATVLDRGRPSIRRLLATTSSTTARSNWTSSGSGPVTCMHVLLVSSHTLNLVHFICVRNGLVARGLGETSINFETSLIRGAIEAGALFSFSGNPTQVTVRVGVSFLSETQACANAESEIGTATFEEIVARSKALWNERLSRIEIDVPQTPPNITELLYSSLYRASLTPVGTFHFEDFHLKVLTSSL